MRMEEIWKIIPGFPLYEVSSLGKIRNIETKQVLKSCIRPGGYKDVNLKHENGYKTRTCHRLVALTYIPNPNNLKTVDHINRIRCDNRVCNLRWASHVDQYANQKPYSRKKPYRPIWMCDVNTNAKLKKFESIQEASKEINPERIQSGEAGIRQVLNGHQLSYLEYKWIYADEIIEGEEWKDLNIDHIEHKFETDGYQISNFGRLKKGRDIRNPRIGDCGYGFFNVAGKKISAHRLVAYSFLENPYNKPIVNHMDCDRSNCRVENLEFVTFSENTKHAADNGLMNTVCIRQYDLYGKFIQSHNSIADAVEKTGILRGKIRCALIYKTGKTGFQWRRDMTDDSDIGILDDPNCNIVLQYKPNGDFVRDFSDQRVATEFHGLSKSAIFRTIDNPKRMCANFQWRKWNSKVPVENIESRKRKRLQVN